MTTALLNRFPERRYGALALTVLVHVALLLAWMAARRGPATGPEAPRRAIQWIRLAPLPVSEPAVERPARPVAPADVAPVADDAVQPRRQALPALPRLAPPSVPVPAPAPGAATSTLSLVPAAPTAMSAPPTAGGGAASAATNGATLSGAPAESLAERARRAAGGVDRALRKENRAYVAAPLDSPQMRLSRGIEAAADMMPNAWYQAPKTAELVNPNGDGVRITRVVTAAGTYCINERPPTASIDTMETLGKQSPYMTCPPNEGTATKQKWRSARD